MELDLDALQQLPAEEEQTTICRLSCKVSCQYTCAATGG
ncbi:ALQxL family class IV lanthipeptide [Streptomyces vinaceus]|nr:ALQxL family class IV lanthipeptide [Streptomyces vinaceus]